MERKPNTNFTGRNTAKAAETAELYELFNEFSEAYQQEWARLDRCERMYRGEHWSDVPPGDENEPRPVTPVLQSTIENVRADLVDYMPEAIVSSDEPEYDALSELFTHIIHENHLRCCYDEEYMKMTHDLLVGGYGVQQTGFDPDANGGIGGAFLCHVDNHSVMFDPLCSDLQDGRAVFKFTHHTRDWFEQHYPDKADELREDGLLAELPREELLAPRYDRSILLIECWRRVYDPEKEKYAVHMMKLAGGVMLEDSRDIRPDGYFAHGEYPFVITKLFERKGSCLGYGFVDLFETSQRNSDKLDQIVMKNALLASHNKLLITGASGFDPADLRDWSKEVHQGDNLNGISWFSTAPLPAYMLSYIAEMRNSIKEESGANEFARGMTHAGVTSGTAIAALQEASSKRSRMAARNIHASFRRAVCQEIEVEREFTLRSRARRSLKDIAADMGGDGSALVRLDAIEKALTGLGSLPAEFRVTVKVVKENAFSVMNNNETVFRLVSAGMITPDVGLQLLIFDGKDQAVQLMKTKQLEMNVMNALSGGAEKSTDRA
ncbi:MAG: hypothetical protein IK064_06085 [Clostridia bacterium]|nr:hypothetical protein [Clostridia bacterium]